MSKLVLATTSRFELKWNDKGSGGNMDGAFYRPIPKNRFFIIGDYAQGNYNSPSGTVITVRESGTDPSAPLLAPPEDFVRIWADTGSGADKDGSFWQPIPPEGYVALGSVCQTGYSKPIIPDYRCVRLDQVRDGSAELTWNDRGTGADSDVSVYTIKHTNVLYAQGNYAPPKTVFIPRR